ncbi:MAG: RNA methyltransferase [Ignisphaera sp.]|uniref:Uncharacterized protein n=1 Tax=Ignisphaera aggregans TaxID=334771 RepID=A0A7J3MZC6_9CREN
MNSLIAHSIIKIGKDLKNVILIGVPIMSGFLVVVEHLEPCLNRWILAEYEFVAKIYGSRVIFTNIKNKEHYRILSRYAKVYNISITDMLKDCDHVIVLDPEADKELEPEELASIEYVILGGIMGNHPPRKRTKLYITNRLPHSRARNLGKLQYTISGATYVLRQIELGKKVRDIKFIYGLNVKKILGNNVEVDIHLPYAFPLDEYGNIVLPDDYLEIVTNHLIVHESRILTTTVKDNIC